MYVIAIAFLASWAVSAADQLVSKEDAYADNIPTVCPVPEEFPKNTTTNLPHETECTYFYKCHMGTPIKMICPLMIDGDPVTRLHYNRRLQVCDWPWQAGCESCPRQNRDGTYPPNSRISDPNNNCNYQDCINSHPYPKYCPRGTCFSRTCQECVTNRSGGYCKSGGCGGVETKPHDCDCAKYYRCSNDDFYVEDCESGLHYSPTAKICQPPNVAGCLKPSV